LIGSPFSSLRKVLDAFERTTESSKVYAPFDSALKTATKRTRKASS
jgi:hypothetical protein